MRRSFVLWPLIMIMLLAAIQMPIQSTHAAQVDPSPLVLWMEGDYWRYTPTNGTLEQITTWGWNLEPVISPNGQQIAYGSVATVGVEAIESQDFVGDAAPPINIWVLDIATGDAFRPADQPPGASFLSQNDNFVVRGKPAWSPDGTSLAWTEMLIPGLTFRLAIYNLASATTNFITLNLADQFGLPGPPAMKWGNSGIVIQNFIVDQVTQTPTMMYTLYSGTGSLIRNIGTFSTGDNNTYLLDFQWLMRGNTEWLGILYSNGLWNLADPNGQLPVEVYQGAIELYNPFFPNGYKIQATYGPVNNAFNGTLIRPNGTSVALPNGVGLLGQFSLSTSASGAAYLRTISPNNGAFVWQNGVESQINSGNRFVQGLVWGYGRWRIPGAVPAQPIPATPVVINTALVQCPGFRVSRLSVGSVAHVSPGDANNLRSQPSLNGSPVGQIPGNGQFSVLAGPVCQNQLAWWQVNYNGLVGWTAEGQGDTYWLAPGPTNTIAPDLPGAVLEITEAGSPLIARVSASTNAAEADRLLWGDRVLWLGGRLTSEGLNWLEVTLGSGVVAYVRDTPGALTVRDPGYQTPGMAVGKTAVVTQAGDRMNLRASTSTNSERLKVLFQGDQLAVIGGPVYGEYYIWWNLRTTDGVVGWAVDVPAWLVAQ